MEKIRCKCGIIADPPCIFSLADVRQHAIERHRKINKDLAKK